MNIGIKCILFDLDNTLVPSFKNKPTRKVKDLVEKLKDMGFKVIIFSNSNKKRLTPFKNILEVDCSHSSKKPFSNKVIGCCFSALSKSAGSSFFRIFLSIVPRTLRMFRSL